nr:uncharacterized protein LOC113826423 [Penaeus vannamei]
MPRIDTNLVKSVKWSGSAPIKRAHARPDASLNPSTSRPPRRTQRLHRKHYKHGKNGRGLPRPRAAPPTGGARPVLGLALGRRRHDAAGGTEPEAPRGFVFLQRSQTRRRLPRATDEGAGPVSAALSQEVRLADIILRILTHVREGAQANAPGQAGSRSAEGGSEAWCGVLLAGGEPPRKESAPEMAEILRGIAAAACHGLQRLDGLKDRFVSAIAPSLSWDDMTAVPGVCETHITESPSAEGLELAEGLVQLYSLLQRRKVLMNDAVLEQFPFTARGFVCVDGGFLADFKDMANDLVAVLHEGVQVATAWTRP